MFFPVYCIIRVWNGNNRACQWCWKCVCGLRRPQKIEFLGCVHVLYLLLKNCSDLNEGKLIQFLFYHVVLLKLVGLFIGISFLICGSDCRLKFCRVLVLGKRSQIHCKTDLIRNILILLLLWL